MRSNYQLSDILFYSDLAAFTRFSSTHIKHLISASNARREGTLQPWQGKYADQNFPRPIGHIGKVRFWSKIEMLDWCIENNPAFLEEISENIKQSEKQG